MRTVDEIKQLVREQLDSIEDELVRPAIEEILVEPFSQSGTSVDEKYLCWVVAKHTWPASDFVTLFVYCEDEDSPFKGWGIVGDDMYMGMDSNWFESLERAFYDSFAAIPLKIWNVVKCEVEGDDRIVAANLIEEEAYALKKKLNANEETHPHSHEKYAVEPRTKRWW